MVAPASMMNTPTHTRRQFVKMALAGAVGAPLAATSWADDEPTKSPLLKEIGIIGTVSKEMRADYRGTLRRLSELGYKLIETGRYAGESAPAYLEFLGQLGLRVIAAGGASMAALKKDPTKAIDNALALKAPYLVCYWPWLTGATRLSQEEVLQAAETCNAIGEKCQAAGLRFAVHNHDKELRDVGGQTALELLLKKTHPQWVTVELDIYWLVKGGGDPAYYFEQFPGRFELLHVKDMDHSPSRGMACVGAGLIEWPRILLKAAQAGTKHCIVEHDNPPDGMKCAEDSIRYLRGLKL